MLALVLVAGVAHAQVEPSPPPVVPAEEEAPAIPAVVTPANPPLPPEAPPPQYVTPTYFERCFAVPAQVWLPGPMPGHYYRVSASSAPLTSFHAAQPADAPKAGGTTSSGGSSGGSGGGGIGDGKALLVLAVVAIAVLPIIVYAIDDDAPAVVENRFHCPSFGFDAVGGFESSERSGPVASGSGRLTFGYAYFGSDFQFDLSNGALTSWAGHVMVRIAPKSHIEPNLAFGVRSLAFRGQTRAGLEVGVPHRYVFWREGLRSFSVELRPTFMFGFGTFDVGVEGALIIPVLEPIHVRVGGKVQSFGDDIIGGLNAGVSFVF